MAKDKENIVGKEAAKENSGAPAVEKFIPFSKKKSTKITLAVLIAAAVSSTAVTAYALGGFGEAFADMFIEDSPNGMYSGENIEIESSNTNVEFLGVAGNNEMAATATKLTRADGSAFVDDITDTWIAASSSDEHSAYFLGYSNEDFSISRPNWVKVRYVNDDDLMAGGDIYTEVNFYFNDPSTISVYSITTGVYGGLKGQTVTMHADDLSTYTQKEIVYDFSEHLDEFADSEYYAFDDDYRQALNDCVEKYGQETRNGLILVVNPYTNDFVLAEEKPLDVDFTLSVKLAYKVDETRYSVTNLARAVDGWGSNTKGTFRLTPFTLTLNVNADIPTAQDFWTFGLTNSSIEKETSDQATGMAKFVDYLHMERPQCPETLTVTLTDGTTVIAEDTGLDDGDLSSGKYSVLYRFYPDNGDESRKRPISIDVNDIKTISANGVVIYK